MRQNLNPVVSLLLGEKGTPSNEFRPVGWGCRTRQLHKCPRYNIKQSAGALGNAKYPFIAIVPRSIQAQSDII